MTRMALNCDDHSFAGQTRPENHDLYWDGAVFAQTASEAGIGLHHQEHPMTKSTCNEVAVIGINIVKDSFHVGGHVQVANQLSLDVDDTCKTALGVLSPYT